MKKKRTLVAREKEIEAWRLVRKDRQKRQEHEGGQLKTDTQRRDLGRQEGKRRPMNRLPQVQMVKIP